MKKNVFRMVKAAVTAALYAALTYICAGMGLAFGAVQFRFSEALTVLPVYTPSAVAGLTLGCVLSNIISPVTPLDAVFGSLATLAASLLTRAARNIKIKGFPLLSFLSPVIINGLVVGAEISLFGSEEASAALFVSSAISVAAGEAAVVFTLGTLLWLAAEKSTRLKDILTK